MPEALIVDATRSPWGKFGGGLKDYSAAELASHLMRTLIQRNSIDPTSVENVILGQVLQAGAGQLPARQALIHAGLPVTTPGLLINKVCASGMRAVTLAGQLIRASENDIILAGGMESMSNTPYYDMQTRWGARMGDKTLVDGMVHDGLWCAFDDVHMANQGDDLAAKREISRQEMDDWSVMSQQRWGAAFDRGYFDREVTPMPNKRNPNHMALTKDESPRPNSTAERLGQIATVWGTKAITAGNAPGVNDGAAVLVVTSEEGAARLQAKPIARIIGHAEVATLPGEFPLASAWAIQKVLKKAGLTLDDLAVIEVNEAFAAVPLTYMQEFGVPHEKLNVHGGAIALGHPLGATGAVLVSTAVDLLEERNLSTALVTLCIGGGMGTATIIERV